jgi:hypothetical protein
VTVDQWQLEKLALVTTNQQVLYFAPGLPAEYHPHLWGCSYRDMPSAIQALTAHLSPGAKIAVIPEGPYELASLRTQAEMAPV